MSGTVVSGIDTGLELKYAVDEGGLSSFQIDSLVYENPVKVEEYSDKVLTKTKTERLIKKYSSMDIKEITKSRDKYSISALNLGIVSYQKLKPKFIPASKYIEFTKPKGSIMKGYSVNSRIHFNTLTEAKRYAKEQFLRYGRPLTIEKAYLSKFSGVLKGGKPYLILTYDEVGELKSKPTKAPKSYIVLPKYLFIYDGCVTDPEYEWM